MIVRKYSEAEVFKTKDGSEIRSLLDLSNAPVQNQSLAEASIPKGGVTARHRHPQSEEFYYVVEGEGVMELDGQTQPVRAGDAILIPPGAAHKISNQGAGELKILCCCAPPYLHEDTELLE